MDNDQHLAYVKSFRRRGKVTVQADDVQEFTDYLDQLKVSYETTEKEGATIFTREG